MELSPPLLISYPEQRDLDPAEELALVVLVLVVHRHVQAVVDVLDVAGVRKQEERRTDSVDFHKELGDGTKAQKKKIPTDKNF